jgi:hypothetical protein
LFAKSCTSCHGATPSGGAPNSLVTYADLVAPSVIDPSRSVAAVALDRMRDTASPMPPAGLLSADQVDLMAGWVADGLPQGGGCEDTGAPSDADLYGGAFAVEQLASVCTSKVFWTHGSLGSVHMHPGEACISCHKTHPYAPRFSVAGTVFPTEHEPNNCYGSQGVTVSIRDATGKTIHLTTNAAGNFHTTAVLKPPYHMKVISGVKTRSMSHSVSTGDCNSCHTTFGRNGAPGRILTP